MKQIKGEPVAQIRIGVKIASLQVPFQRAIVASAQSGADAIQLDARTEVRPAEMTRTAIRQLRKQLEDYRLRVASLEFRTRRGYQTEEDLERRIDATKKALSLAYELGATVVVNSIGRIPEDEGSGGWRLLIEALTDIGSHSHRCGATLAADTGYDDPALLLRLIQALPPKSLGINLNPAELIRHGYATLDAASQLSEHIVHVDALDAVRDSGSHSDSYVALGRGSADIPGIMGILEDRGFRGYWTVQATKGPEGSKSVLQAIQFLKGL